MNKKIIIAGGGTGPSIGDGGLATSAVVRPQGILLDARGDIFIAEPDDDRIRKIDALTGVINTIAGNGTQGYSGDGGLATMAGMRQPTQMAIDNSGTIYFSEFFI